MQFDRDENKRLINSQRHGIDFADVWEVFQHATYSIIDDRFDYGELRFFTIGLLNGRVIAISHTENTDVIRIISVRKGNKMTKKHTLTTSQTDWAKFDAMTDDEIDYSDIPPITPEMWKNAVVRRNLKVIPKKTSLSLKIDTDVKDFFKSEGRGYQAKINQLLRAYMENAKKAG